MKKKTKTNTFKWTATLLIYGLLYGIIMSTMFGLGALYHYITNNFAFVLMKTLVIAVTVPLVFILFGLILDILESYSKNKKRLKK